MDEIIELRKILEKKGLCDTSLDKFIKRFLLVFTVFILSFIPRPDMNEILGWMGVGLLLTGVVDLNINQYLYIKQGTSKMSIYKSLKETAICKKDFIKFGIKIHCKYMLKLFCVCFILRMCCIFAFETLTIEYMLYVIESFCIFIILTTLSVAHEFYVATKD